jgi:cytochrome c
MRWFRNADIWLAALAGFLLGRAAPELLPTAAESASRPRTGRWRLALGSIVLVLGCAAAGTAWHLEQDRQEADVARALTGGEPTRGPALIARFGCAGCHTVPGVPGADGQVGPALAGLRKRVFVGGVMRNNAANLIDWIVDPRAASPRTAMPVTGISSAQARDVAAYLYSH